MKLTKTKLRQVIKEELDVIAAAEEYITQKYGGDVDYREVRDEIVMGAPYEDDGYELWNARMQFLGELTPGSQGRMKGKRSNNTRKYVLEDYDVDRLNQYLAKQQKYVLERRAEAAADLPEKIWTYGDQLKSLRKKWGHAPGTKPDHRYYYRDHEPQSGYPYYRRRDKFDAHTKGDPFNFDRDVDKQLDMFESTQRNNTMKLTKAKLKQIIKEELINEARRSRAVSYLIEGPDGEIVVTPRSHTLMSESGEPMTLTRGSRGRSKPIDLWKVLKEWFQAEYSGEFLSGK